MKIVLPGKPIPKIRPRFCQKGKMVMTYDSQEKDKFKVKTTLRNAVQNALLFADQDTILGEKQEIAEELSNFYQGVNFSVWLSFHIPIPDSDSQATKNAKLWGFIKPISKPDLDNLEKFYLDCINELLFPDDSMVTLLSSKKQFSHQPRTEITIMSHKNTLSKKSMDALSAFNPSKLEAFISDASKLSQIHLHSLNTSNEEQKTTFLNDTANLLIAFADKYADILKKIRKYESTNPDFQKLDICKAALQQKK